MQYSFQKINLISSSLPGDFLRPFLKYWKYQIIIFVAKSSFWKNCTILNTSMEFS